MWAIPYLFERLFLISWENNRDCHITMPLSLKTMEVQIKGDQSNKRFRMVQVYWNMLEKTSGWIGLSAPGEGKLHNIVGASCKPVEEFF